MAEDITALVCEQYDDVKDTKQKHRMIEVANFSDLLKIIMEVHPITDKKY